MGWRERREAERLARALQRWERDGSDRTPPGTAAADLPQPAAARWLRTAPRPHLDHRHRDLGRRRVLQGLGDSQPSAGGSARAGEPRHRRQASTRHGAAVRRPHPGLMGLAAAVLVVVLAAALLSVAARSAGPDDNLYVVKRLGERAAVSLTLDDDDRGLLLLRQAESRLSELTRLLITPAGDGGPRDAGRVTGAVLATLATMDAQTRDGVALITDDALVRADADTLRVLPDWAAGQTGALDDLTGRMTAAQQRRAEMSLTLLHRVEERADVLVTVWPRRCLAGAGRDDLGPVPPTACTAGD